MHPPTVPANRQDEAATRSPLIVFDVLRALAAFLVVFSHSRNFFMPFYAGQSSLLLKAFYFLSGFGHQAVMVFFVISGYWISRSVITRVEQNRWMWSGYFVDRLTRLWIVLVPALLLGGCFDYAGIHFFRLPVYGDGVLVNSDIAQHLDLRTLLENVFFLQGPVGPVFGSNGPLWSLANEFWYYLWFAAIYLLFVQPRRPQTWIAVAITAASMLAFRTLLPGFVSWLMGVALFLVSRRQVARAGARRWLFPLGCGVFAVGMVASRFQSLQGNWADMVVAASTAVFLLGYLMTIRTSPAALKPAAWFGANASYSLYLVHYPLIVLASGLVGIDRSAGAQPGFLTMGGVLLMAAAAVGFSLLFAWLTERNTPVLRHWIEQRLGAMGLAIRTERTPA